METLKLKIAKNADIQEDLRLYNDVLRIAFNRYQDGYNEKRIRLYLKKLPTFDGLNSWFIQSAIKTAEGVYNRFGNEKIIFGGKLNYERYQKKLISKEEYKANK